MFKIVIMGADMNTVVYSVSYSLDFSYKAVISKVVLNKDFTAIFNQFKQRPLLNDSVFETVSFDDVEKFVVSSELIPYNSESELFKEFLKEFGLASMEDFLEFLEDEHGTDYYFVRDGSFKLTEIVLKKDKYSNNFIQMKSLTNTGDYDEPFETLFQIDKTV